MLVFTNDTFTFTVPDAVARKCGTLCHALECQAGCPPAGVPLPNVASCDMVRVVQFFTRLDSLRQAEAAADTVEAWKTVFFDGMARSELYPLMEAANYLDASELFDAACTHVANLLRGCGPEEIRRILMLPEDADANERRAVAEEFAWAIP